MIIYANLDCEARWAGVTLPKHVLERISAAAALLAAFAPAGEPVEIWAPAAIDPARVRIDGLTLRTGTPPRWDLAWAEPDAKPVNDRRFALAIARELGVALPGARVVGSLAELDEVAIGRWVCKAPWTAAGRDRVHGDGALTGELRVYASRLLERFGALVFEPWLEREVDFGVVDHRVHTLLSDPRGGFLGIDLAAPALPADPLPIADAVRARLDAAGYTGPLGIDGFVYRPTTLHPFCEINARHTFGHVARALASRFGARVLGFGPPPADARVLVAPGERDPVTAWIRA